MINIFKESIISQFRASLSMFSSGLAKFEESRWLEPVANMKLCQLAFHTYFFTDLYLSLNIPAAQAQEFHFHHAAEFGEYEELQDDSQRATYDRSFIDRYKEFIEKKLVTVIEEESVESLQEPSQFEWLEMSRAEAHLYNVRHVQYHAGQLGLLIRQETGQGVPWVKQG